MKNNDLFELFVHELEDMYSCENQIVKALPKLIKAASLSELRDALTKHLEETRQQVRRIEKIFSILNISPQEITCEAMHGILQEGDELVTSQAKSPVLDAAIISAAQKVEHYEIASYGTLRSFAKQLDLESEVVDLLKDTLDEEGAADKKLTKIAEGGFFVTGVNKDAVETTGGHHKRK